MRGKCINENDNAKTKSRIHSSKNLAILFHKDNWANQVFAKMHGKHVNENVNAEQKVMSTHPRFLQSCSLKINAAYVVNHGKIHLCIKQLNHTTIAIVQITLHYQDTKIITQTFIYNPEPKYELDKL